MRLYLMKLRSDRREKISKWRDILQGRGTNYITEGRPDHGEAQFLKGGANHSELVFSYTPGSLRKNEPTYTNKHSFAITPDNIFVWTRFTDRYDTRNRKLLFIEETSRLPRRNSCRMTCSALLRN